MEANGVSPDSLKAVIASVVPASLPVDWIIMNAPRPLMGDKLADGEFLTGRFYAAIDPAGDYAQSMVDRNVKDEARVVLVASEELQTAMALSGIRAEYQAAYAEMDEKERSDALSPFVRKLNDGKTYGELKALSAAAGNGSASPSILDAVSMSPLERARLAAQLAGKVKELAAIPADSGGPAVVMRIRLATEANALLVALFGSPGDDAVAQAQAYFRENLRGLVINTKIGDVHLLGSSFKEMKRGMKRDAVEEGGEGIDGDGIMAHSIDGDEVSLAPA